MRKLIVTIASLVWFSSTAAQAMTVAEFLAKAAALRKQGVLAAASPDVGKMRDEVTQAGADYRKTLAAEVAAGRTPSSCPPPVGKAGIGSAQLIAYFTTIPPAQRGMSVKTAVAGLMRQRYPCH